MLLAASRVEAKGHWGLIIVAIFFKYRRVI